MAHVLHGEGRVLVLRVDPDHPVAQTPHGEDGPGWEGGTAGTGPGGEGGYI